MAKQFRCAFFTHDYDRSVEFYKNVLGFAISESWDRAVDDKGTTFMAGSGMIEVLTMPQEDEDWVWSQERPRGFAIVIELDDVDAFYDELVGKNVPIAKTIADMPWRHRSFQIADPNGVRLYFYSEI
ncbi:MAG TPA: VOC family protein [Pyrinomonadaceae bacterium]|jgi:catechol 2,3-dioxygenase-like lactoylglutathione lyase family enzyme